MWTELAGIAQQLPPLALICLVAWLVTMISVPVLEWTGGEKARTTGVAAGVILQAATVLAILVPAWGGSATAQVAGIVVLSGWLAEWIGSHTGVPFGRYRYTGRLQPQIGGVPVVIPLAWLMMLPPAWAVASAITDRMTTTGSGAFASFVLTGALAFTAWDLFLDPQMVKWRLWVWEPAAGHRWRYFGIPWSNYLGWFLVSGLVTLVAAPHTLPWEPVRPALLGVYALTWALETFGQLVFWRLPGSAMAGASGMGLCLLWALI